LIRKHIEGAQRWFCRTCTTPVYENPVPAACSVVVDNRKVLLVRRSVAPKAGMWCLPGGFMELGERPEQAALRELLEETGLCGSIQRLLGVTTNPSPRYGTVLMVGYLVRGTSGLLQPGDDASAADWFAIEDLPEIAFSSHRHFIRITHAAYMDE
jgi:ADP-ribose pyrophosphatase YjhB (NUDIX family)